MRVLGETNGRVGGADGAAARMGINRTTLISRMKRLGIPPKITPEMPRASCLYIVKAVMSGRADQVLDLAVTNLWR
jgi:hypothetical protein